MEDKCDKLLSKRQKGIIDDFNDGELLSRLFTIFASAIFESFQPLARFQVSYISKIKEQASMIRELQRRAKKSNATSVEISGIIFCSESCEKVRQCWT